MATPQTDERTPQKPLRLWPGVVAVVLQWLLWLVVPIVVPGAGGTAILGGVAAGVAVVVWWLFFSRAPWSERVGAIVLMVVAVPATKRIVHESIANGMMGMMLPVFSIPVLSLALVASAAAGRRLSTGPRRASMAAAILLACGAMTLLRTGGVTGDADSDLHWRWTETPEERLLAQAGDEPATRPADPAGARTDADWPGFRGRARDGIVRGARIETDWSRKPPVALWRRPIGPGWSSFAVHGTLL
jgi:outer membrane protein assembly factor BamB